MYSTERTLSEHGDKVPAADKQAIEAALNETREALKTEDLERIKKAQEALTTASHKLAEAMYREAQAKAQSPGPRRRRPGAGRAAPARRETWSTPSSRIWARRSSRAQRPPGGCPPGGRCETTR